MTGWAPSQPGSIELSTSDAKSPAACAAPLLCAQQGRVRGCPAVRGGLAVPQSKACHNAVHLMRERLLHACLGESAPSLRLQSRRQSRHPQCPRRSVGSRPRHRGRPPLCQGEQGSPLHQTHAASRSPTCARRPGCGDSENRIASGPFLLRVPHPAPAASGSVGLEIASHASVTTLSRPGHGPACVRSRQQHRSVGQKERRDSLRRAELPRLLLPSRQASRE